MFSLKIFWSLFLILISAHASTQEKTTSFLSNPQPEFQEKILHYISAAEISPLKQVNKHWHNTLTQEEKRLRSLEETAFSQKDYQTFQQLRLDFPFLRRSALWHKQLNDFSTHRLKTLFNLAQTNSPLIVRLPAKDLLDELAQMLIDGAIMRQIESLDKNPVEQQKAVLRYSQLGSEQAKAIHIKALQKGTYGFPQNDVEYQKSLVSYAYNGSFVAQQIYLEQKSLDENSQQQLIRLWSTQGNPFAEQLFVQKIANNKDGLISTLADKGHAWAIKTAYIKKPNALEKNQYLEKLIKLGYPQAIELRIQEHTLKFDPISRQKGQEVATYYASQGILTALDTLYFYYPKTSKITPPQNCHFSFQILQQTIQTLSNPNEFQRSRG